MHPRHDRARYLTNLTLLFVFLLTSVNPLGLPLAQVRNIAKPGLGVSRMPLNVMNFGAPGFGDLEQIVNVTNGNLFVTLNSLALNTGGTEGDQLGDGLWDYNERLELLGLTSATSKPSTLTLRKGDGSFTSFSRVKVETGGRCDDVKAPLIPFENIPEWIVEDYAGINIGFCIVDIYQQDSEPGLSYSGEFLVRSSNGKELRYYTADGVSHSFNIASPFVTHSQTPHQRYASRNKSTYATKYTYEPGTGNVTLISDAQSGRATRYTWDVRHNQRVPTR